MAGYTKAEFREMYRSCKAVDYKPRGESMYLAVITLKDGAGLKLPFDCDDRMSPYDFVIKYVIVWLFSTQEINRIELTKEGHYFESYTPKLGWFKTKGVAME
jgi:hypothetical protein